MIRITLLTLLIAYLSAYAWKDWFRAACWLVLLMAVFQHPDMPKAIGGIPGLNHWNFLFLNVVFSWLINRKKQKLSWEMPRHINVMLFFYGVFIMISVVRYLADPSGVIEGQQTYSYSSPLGVSAINEYLINCFKWVLPAMIIFDGTRDRKKYNFAVIMLALMFVFLALQVVKAMQLGSLGYSGDALQARAQKIISKNVGYHRVNISMMMSGAFWAVFCLKEYVSKKHFLILIIPACLCILLAMAMTGGRTGYGTWGVLGLIFCVFKWRKYLLLAPVMLAGIIIFAPSAVERMMQGMVAQQSEIRSKPAQIDFEAGEMDLHSITSGRIIAWPLVWQSITEAPFFGYGRNAMINIGMTKQIMDEHGKGEGFPHPHNAYLQWLQDNGIVGAVPVFLFYLLMVRYSWSLFQEQENRIYVVSGGLSLALLTAFLIASWGSQTFYPREGAVGMWVAIALMMRVYIERDKVRSGKASELIEPTEIIKHKYFVKV